MASPFPSHKFIDEPLPNPLLVECKPRQSVMFVQALNENPLNIRNTFFHRRRCHLCRLRRRRHRRCCRRYHCCHHRQRCCSGSWFHHRLFPKSTHLPQICDLLRCGIAWIIFVFNIFPTLCHSWGSNPRQSVELHRPGTF